MLQPSGAGASRYCCNTTPSSLGTLLNMRWAKKRRVPAPLSPEDLLVQHTVSTGSREQLPPGEQRDVAAARGRRAGAAAPGGEGWRGRSAPAGTGRETLTHEALRRRLLGWTPAASGFPAPARNQLELEGGRMEGARGCARCRRGAGVRAHPLLLTARLTNSRWLTAGYSRDLEAQTETPGSSPEPNATPAWPRPPLPPSLPSHSAESPDLLRGRSTPTKGLASIKPGDFHRVPSKARV